MKTKDKDIVEEARDFLKEAEDAENENRENFKADIRFSRLSEQWPEKMFKKREQEGRPCLTFNRLQSVIRQVVNDGRLNRPQVKVVAVDDKGDKEVADVYSGIIKNIETQSNADAAYDTGIDNAVSGGWGYLTVDIDYIDDEGFEQDIRIMRVPDPLCIYGDPNSESVDSSDWEQAIEVKKIPRDKFEKLYPKAQQTDFEVEEWGNVGDSWIDTDSVTIAKYWKRTRNERVIIGLSDGSVVDLKEYENEAEAYMEAGIQPVTQPRSVPSYKVSCHTLNGVEELDTKEWIGKFIPIVPIYGDEIWEGGERHLRSLIHDAIDANRMYNYWRSAETEMVALAPRVPFVGEEGSFNDPKWSMINDSSIAFVTYKKGAQRPTREMGPQIPAGMSQQALTAADDIKAITGIYDASLGARSNETSGVAINARKVEGEVSTFHFQDNLTRAIRHLGLILIDLIPKVYSTERMMRVIGEDGEAEIVPVNAEQEDPETGGVLKVNDLTAGKYDVAVSAGPSFTTRRAEAADQMMELVRVYPDAAPIIGDLLAKNLDWPGSDEIADRLKKLLPEQLQENEDGEPELPPEMSQMIQQMQEALQQASERIQELESGEQEKVLKQLNEKKKLEISEYDAETKRLSATRESMSPEQMQALILETIGDILNAPDDIPETESAFAGQATEQPEPVPAI